MIGFYRTSKADIYIINIFELLSNIVETNFLLSIKLIYLLMSKVFTIVQHFQINFLLVNLMFTPEKVKKNISKINFI